MDDDYLWIDWHSMTTLARAAFVFGCWIVTLLLIYGTVLAGILVRWFVSR